MFVYFAELLNKDIHPNIENYYNYFFVKDAERLATIINTPSFVFNTRTVKYILKLDRQELVTLMGSMATNVQQELFRLAVSNNYHTINDYRDNLDFINKSLTNNKITNYGYQFTEGSARNA